MPRFDLFIMYLRVTELSVHWTVPLLRSVLTYLFDLRVYQQFTIQTPDANSFRAAQSHIIADAHKQALAAARKILEVGERGNVPLAAPRKYRT
jgi:hypothetical protein